MDCLSDHNYRGQPKAGTGHKISFFQCLVSRAPLSAVTIVVIVKLEGIPDSTKIIIFEGTKTSTIFRRDYFMSENLRVDI